MNVLTPGKPSLDSLQTDALVVGLTGSGDDLTVVSATPLPEPTVEFLKRAARSLRASSKVATVTRIAGPAGIEAATVVLVGLGDEEPTTTTLRRAAGAATRALAGHQSAVIALPHGGASDLAAIAQGALSGTYTFTAHKTKRDKDEDQPVDLDLSVISEVEDAPGIVARAEVLSRAVNWARDLVNTPPNVLYPQSFADEVERVVEGSSAPITLRVLDDSELIEGGFGGIVGVGQGSARPPRIVAMEYAPKGAKSKIALVGKGITFDTGGVCIKPAGSMTTMKSDMGGAAAVAATVLAAAELELPVAVTSYLCLAENMPGSNAQRPGDVVTMRKGTTVEVINTDAEGRMVLADGMTLAVEDGAETIIDVATLTGAAMVALGPKIYAVMANDEALSEQILAAAKASDEPAWPMPLPEELRDGLKSEVADLTHMGERWGGALTAGLFLKEFATTTDGEPIPWAHLDIAGPAFNEAGPAGDLPKGGTGVAVASLVALLEAKGAEQ